MKELKYIIAIGVILLVHSCANRGTPSGGEYDRTPPVVLESSPENFTNNFTSSEIIKKLPGKKKKIYGIYTKKLSLHLNGMKKYLNFSKLNFH